MTATTLAPPRAAQRASITAFVAMLARDMRVVRKQLGPFLIRTIMQPLLTTFVFAYVFPKIGQGVGGSGASEDQFSTLLAPGLISFALIFQGIQAVALPLVNEFGYTREIDDRVIAPLPVWAVGMQKIASGAVQAAFAAAITLPIVCSCRARPCTSTCTGRCSSRSSRSRAYSRVPSVSRSGRASSPARCR